MGGPVAFNRQVDTGEFDSAFEIPVPCQSANSHRRLLKKVYLTG
jgi:hypothetical protein